VPLLREPLGGRREPVSALLAERSLFINETCATNPLTDAMSGPRAAGAYPRSSRADRAARRLPLHSPLAPGVRSPTVLLTPRPVRSRIAREVAWPLELHLLPAVVAASAGSMRQSLSHLAEPN